MGSAGSRAQEAQPRHLGAAGGTRVVPLAVCRTSSGNFKQSPRSAEGRGVRGGFHLRAGTVAMLIMGSAFVAIPAAAADAQGATCFGKHATQVGNNQGNSIVVKPHAVVAAL